jgi:methionyl-tRNA formyltransferase
MKILVLCNDRMALPALNQLIQNRLVVAVAMTDRSSEVHLTAKSFCDQAQLPLIQLTKANLALELRGALMQFQPDAVLVKTFPWKIPAELLTIPKWGFYNFHYAPLPEYKGPNPLFWMIKNGDKQGGVTVHRMTENFDEGPIVLKSKFPIQKNTTFGLFTGQLGYNGLELTGQLLMGLQNGSLVEEPQDNTKGNWYNRPEQKDLMIDWAKMSASDVERLVNACNPWNKGAVAHLENGWMIGLTHASPTVAITENEKSLAPGTIVHINEKDGLCIRCAGNTTVSVTIVYTEEGFFPGYVLANLGLKSGMSFV